MDKRRSSVQSEQEQKSRLQLAECLTDFGWHLTSPSPDLGEDFIVEIYHNGKNTGVTFYIQEKSVTNLVARRSKDYVVYPLKVKDLKHWEAFSLPVVIVIWDVHLREGRWCLVKDLISYLDHTNAKWRKNKKVVQTHLPWENGTDKAGLRKLKVDIGRHVYPLISSGKDLSLSMKFAFPNTPEGIKLQKSFDLHVKEGEPITLKGDVIQELKFSDWWEVWFGEFDFKEAEIYIGESSSKRNVPLSFKIIPTNGKTISLSNLVFRPVRVGIELVKLSNEHTTCPLLFILSFRKEENLIQGKLNCRFRHVGGDPHEILNFLDFTKAISSGGKLQVEFHDVNQTSSTDFLPVPEVSPEPEFYDLVQKLCAVQDKMGHFFRIPGKGISQKDANAIHELFEIVEHGVVHYTDRAMTLELNGEGLNLLLDLKKQGTPIHIELTTLDSYVELFGEKIQTGPMSREVIGFVEMEVQEFEKAIKALSPEEFLNVKLINVNGAETFSDWASLSSSSDCQPSGS